MILVPLFDLKFMNEFAAGGAGTSNRRHEERACEFPHRPARTMRRRVISRA
jgi:hypothetical protein